VLEECPERLEVRAGAQGFLAGAGHHEHVLVFMGAECVDRLGDGDRGVSVHTVVNLGTVQRENGDALLPLHEHLLSRRFSFSSVCRRRAAQCGRASSARSRCR
jgi:hypothetical protein